MHARAKVKKLEHARKATLPDINLKKYKKGITKPVFSNEPYCYEMDLMNLSEHYILFLIGLNNKYVFVFSMANKDTDNFIYYIDWLLNNGVIIKSIRTDGESAVRAKDFKNFMMVELLFIVIVHHFLIIIEYVIEL